MLHQHDYILNPLEALPSQEDTDVSRQPHSLSHILVAVNISRQLCVRYFLKSMQAKILLGVPIRKPRQARLVTKTLKHSSFVILLPSKNIIVR